MDLRRAEISQFRSIKQLSIEFDERCQVLLGINETGKSNILRALSLLSPSIAPVADDVRQVGSEEEKPEAGKVRFVFDLTPTDHQRILAGLQQRIVAGDDELRISTGTEELSLAGFLTAREKQALYVVAVPSGKRHVTTWKREESLVVEEGWFTASDQCPAGHVVNVPTGAPRLKDLVAIHSSARNDSMPEPYLRPLTAEDLSEAVLAEVRKFVESELPVCIPWSYVNNAELPSALQLDGFIANPDSAPVLKNMFGLAGINDVRAEVTKARARTNGMRMLLERVGDHVSKELRALWTDKQLAVELSENGPMIECVIRDVHGIYDFARRSDGFRRFVSFMLRVSSRARTGTLAGALLLYDEPDTSLHPAGARQLRDELLRLANTCHVIYSTHSIFMVDPNNVPRHLIVRRDREETSVQRATYGGIRDEEVLFQAIGHTIFADLRARNLLFEGYRDRRLFETALLRDDVQDVASSFADVGRCYAQGVKQVPRVVPLIELSGRAYIVVSDGDAPAKEAQRVHQGEGSWFTYPELTGGHEETAEDFVAINTIARAVAASIDAHPDLRHVDCSLLDPSEPVLRAIDKQLGQARVVQKKVMLNVLKEAVFASLVPADLRPSTAGLVRAIATKLGAALDDPRTAIPSA